MYTEFYSLKEKPFNLTPSSRFLYLGESHREALALLNYGVMERKGFILLTGEVGTGKTTMVQALLKSFDESVQYVQLSNPVLSPMEFMNYLAFSALKKRVHFKSKADFILEFEEFLQQCLQHQKNFVLIIDEAQKLSFELLEEIRLLSNMETADEKLINIFLVGQPELNERLSEPRCRPLLQRISIRHHISPLNFEEAREYVTTRLKVAGSKNGDNTFSKSTIKAIHHYSKGYPRMINILADNTLLLGYSRGKRKIKPEMVQQCYDDMNLEDSFLRISQEIPEPYEIKKAEQVRAGHSWKWVTVLFFMIVILAVGMSQRGRNILWQLSGLIPVKNQAPVREIQKQKVMVKKKIDGKAHLVSENLMEKEAMPGDQTGQKEAESVDGISPGKPMEIVTGANTTNQGTVTSEPIDVNMVQDKASSMPRSENKALSLSKADKASTQPQAGNSAEGEIVSGVALASVPEKKTDFVHLIVPQEPKENVVRDRISSQTQPGVRAQTGIVSEVAAASVPDEKAESVHGITQDEPKEIAGIPVTEDTQSWKFVIVKEGDIFSKLVARVYGRANEKNVELVHKHNTHIEDTDRIEAGQKIIFPPPYATD